MQLTDRELFLLVCITQRAFLGEDDNDQYVEDTSNLIERVENEWKSSGSPEFDYPDVTS